MTNTRPPCGACHGPRRRTVVRVRPGALAALLAAVVWPAAAWVTAGEPPPGGTAAHKPPALPAPPAFHTLAVSRIGDVQGDSFLFTRQGGSKVRIRLADAQCASLDATVRANARTVATRLLEEAPVWVFPFGQAAGADGDEIWACVWTSKGWLSEVLVGAGYARRVAAAARQGGAGEAALGPLQPAPSAAAPPGPPAFAPASCAVAEGDSFQADHAGRKVRVQLADVTCQDLESPRREAARTEAARILAAGSVWVLPCSVHRGADGDEVRARVWTAGGWLSEALLKAGLANRSETEPRPSGSGAVAPGPALTVKPPVKPPPSKQPAPDEIKWREVSVAVGSGAAMSCRSSRFKIEAPVWRISWNLKPWRAGSPVSLSVCRVDENVTTGGVSTHVASYAGVTGSTVIRAQPGTFWIQITGSPQLGVKVEVPEQP
ncbi:MAG: hypothetical protein FJ288_14440 [Planctomycetes bacterium]|nr:hypothetical protein [Planctomycetota bacterium]